MAQHRQVVYNLATWSPHQRGELVALLTGRGISHDWRTATTLVVADLVESEVDVMVSAVHPTAAFVLDDDGTKRFPEPHGGAGPPAPLLLRGWAFLIDAMLMLVFWWFAMGSSLDGSTEPTAGRVVGAAVLALYFIGFVAVAGQTPGKMAVKLHIVVDSDGAVPGVWRAAVRFAVPNLVWVVGLSLGFSGPADQVWQALVYGTALLGPRRRGLHDLAAGTIVVRNRPSA